MRASRLELWIGDTLVESADGDDDVRRMASRIRSRTKDVARNAKIVVPPALNNLVNKWVTEYLDAQAAGETFPHGWIAVAARQFGMDRHTLGARVEYQRRKRRTPR